MKALFTKYDSSQVITVALKVNEGGENSKLPTTWTKKKFSQLNWSVRLSFYTGISNCSKNNIALLASNF